MLLRQSSLIKISKLNNLKIKIEELSKESKSEAELWLKLYKENVDMYKVVRYIAEYKFHNGQAKAFAEVLQLLNED